MEVRNINLAVVDNDRSAYSGRLTEKASASAYFNLVDVASSYEEAMEGVESGQTDIILEIPEKFERRLTTEGAAQVLIAANAVNGTKGGLGSSYLTAIVNELPGPTCATKPPRSLGFRPRRPFGSPRSTSSTRI